MMGLSLGEVLVILFFALLAFGPKQIPKIARILGRLTHEIKRIGWDISRAMNELEREVEKTIPKDEIADLAPKESPKFVIEQGRLSIEKPADEESSAKESETKDKEGAKDISKEDNDGRDNTGQKQTG